MQWCRWPKVQPLVKSYLGNSLHLLGEARILLWYPQDTPGEAGMHFLHLTVIIVSTCTRGNRAGCSSHRLLQYPRAT